jgi:hypothetical protein
MISVAALALAGCGTAYGDAGTATATAVPPPAVTQSMPEQMASLDPSDSILFWSDERLPVRFANCRAAQRRCLPRCRPNCANTWPKRRLPA